MRSTRAKKSSRFGVIVNFTLGYMFATMSESELQWHNGTLSVFSCVYVFLVATLGQIFLGAGLVYAQIINMIIRILHGSRFVANQNSEQFGKVLYDALPVREVSGILIFSLTLGTLSSQIILGGSFNIYFKIICHALIGILSGLMVLVGILRYEISVRNLFMSMGAYTFMLEKVRPVVEKFTGRKIPFAKKD